MSENYELQRCKDTLSHFIDIKAEDKADWNKMQEKLYKIFTYIVENEIKKGELKQQIEKMKCCANCLYYISDMCTYICIPVSCNDNCDEWELAK